MFRAAPRGGSSPKPKPISTKLGNWKQRLRHLFDSGFFYVSGPPAEVAAMRPLQLDRHDAVGTRVCFLRQRLGVEMAAALERPDLSGVFNVTGTNSAYNHLVVDRLTGRARIERPELQ